MLYGYIWFLIAVHCDITVWYMTSVMGTNRSIYLFTPERPRDLSARSWARPPGALILLRAHRTASFETSQDGVNISEHISNALPQSKEFCVLFALYGLVCYPRSLTLTSSGRYEIRWLNLILKVVAAILAAWLAKSLTSLLACSPRDPESVV